MLFFAFFAQKSTPIRFHNHNPVIGVSVSYLIEFTAHY